VEPVDLDRATQAAQELGVDATALYPPIRRLEAAGALVKLGRELHLPR